jgi:hypothetical protein
MNTSVHPLGQRCLLLRRRDLVRFCEKTPPGLTVTVWAVRAHLLGHLADQLVGELALAT